MPAIPAAKIAEVKRLRAAGIPVRAIVRKTGVSKTAVYRALSPRKTPPQAAANNGDPRLDARKLLRQIPPDTRGLTARIAGDPLKGRSALDKERGVADA